MAITILGSTSSGGGGSSIPVVQSLPDNNATITAGTTVARIPALTASRFYNLPLASGYPNGSTLTILDSAGSLSSSVVANISSATDIINSANPLILSTPYASPVLISNGVDKWTLDIRGVSRGGTGATDAAAARTNLGLGTGNSPAFLSQSLAGQNLTGTQATSLVDLAATWNTTGTPTAIKLNVTDTASNAASNLMDLQVGGVSKFTVGKTGAINANANFIINGTILQSGGNIIPAASLVLDYFNQDVKLTREANGILAQRNGTAKQTLRIYNTYTSATVYERAVMDWNGPTPGNLQIGTEFLGSGSGMAARPIDFVTGGVVRMSISATGGVSLGAGTAAAPSLTFGDSGTGLWRQSADRLGISAAGTNIVVVYSSGMYMASGAFGVNGNNWLRIGTTGVEVTTTAVGGTLTDLKMRNVIQSPGVGTTVTPANNSELVFETTSNTSVTVKLKGTDGTVRSFALTLV